MTCTACGGDTTVYDSRTIAAGREVWRRRKCLECSLKFTTKERVEVFPTAAEYRERFVEESRAGAD